jgi:hypothetical protein
MRKTYDFLLEGKISAYRGVRDETATRKLEEGLFDSSLCYYSREL